MRQKRTTENSITAALVTIVSLCVLAAPCIPVYAGSISMIDAKKAYRKPLTSEKNAYDKAKKVSGYTQRIFEQESRSSNTILKDYGQKA